MNNEIESATDQIEVEKSKKENLNAKVLDLNSKIESTKRELIEKDSTNVSASSSPVIVKVIDKEALNRKHAEIKKLQSELKKAKIESELKEKRIENLQRKKDGYACLDKIVPDDILNDLYNGM